MKSGPIRVGVIGLGVGEQHVITYNQIPDCRVTDVCDLDPEHLREVANRHDVAGRHVHWRHMLEKADLDVLSICGYDNGHAEQVVAALGAGLHVMVEKPLALHRREAEAVARALQDSGRRLTSNLILRQSPRFKRIHAMARAGAFGKIVHIEGDYLHDILWKITEGWRGRMDFYCTVYGGGIHLIDLMRWIIGDEVESVMAMGTDLLTRNSSYRWPDTITALMRYRSGATGKTTTMYGPRRRKFHALNVYGDRLSFENGIPNGRLFHGDQDEDEETMDTPYPGVGKGGHLPDFIAALRSGGDPPVLETDIFRVMDTCFAIWEACETGRQVPIDYLI
ncbi:MAG: Gfo/Idh/MocA family oxidoreductase [Rhodospirillum sp.]|nr:Gfo/Idh/MocA family oxidoreductase [Rhodospirillum sp.]MCF8490786.1 Gfo/Idh/MocA family oxidoreductase [Rhodospirillum sp.]MCF8499847.1 Gfo/Idh/MocA family oxidoreductase [Rhodospirillum sp.]